MRIHCLQHVSFETAGTILEWVKQHATCICYTNFFEEGYTLPPSDAFDFLLVLGGPFNVDEEEKFPFLQEEKRFIKKAIDDGKKIMGICLGSQLIAAALGKKVYKGPETEIGFFPVTFTADALQQNLFNHFTKSTMVFQWHGDTFDLPDDAVAIASSAAYKNQAFVIGNNVLALQFHLEMNKEIVEQMLIHEGTELNEKGTYIQTEEQIKNNLHYLDQNKKDIFLLLDNFLGV